MGDATIDKRTLVPSPKARELYKSHGKEYDKLCTYVVSLSVKDREFVETFAEKLENVIRRPDQRRKDIKSLIKTVKKGKSIHYTYRRGVTTLMRWVESLKRDELEKIILDDPEWFLMGLYDSEGTLTLKGNFGATIYIFNTDTRTIRLASKCLKKLNIDHSVVVVRKSGTKVKLPNGSLYETKKPLYAIKISKKKDIRRFAHLVGSYIPRKNPLPHIECNCPICSHYRKTDPQASSL